MLWTHHFTDANASELERLYPGLEARGYSGLEIVALESGHLLQATEVRTHTVDSLSSVCAELDAFAKEYGGPEYDGFDVGNVDGSVLIKS
jgi:Regulator of ribonuclease activity B